MDVAHTISHTGTHLEDFDCYLFCFYADMMGKKFLLKQTLGYDLFYSTSESHLQHKHCGK